MKTIAFFNNKGGVGKTSLAYHLAWMFSEQGIPTLAVDLDPQANLTAMFVNEDKLEQLWPEGSHPGTIAGALEPVTRGIGDIDTPEVLDIGKDLWLLAGDLALSGFEDRLSENWSKGFSTVNEAPFRVTTAFHRLITRAADQCSAKLVLIDVGPNLGAINRSAMLASNSIVLPLSPDLYSLQGLKNLGPELRRWRSEWKKMLKDAPQGMSKEELPAGQMQPIGYVIMQHGVRGNSPARAYEKWMKRIPTTYRKSVLGESAEDAPEVQSDPYLLALLKHYRSLMPMAMEARKPIFSLTAADGAFGSHAEAVRNCRLDFQDLSKSIAKNVGMAIK